MTDADNHWGDGTENDAAARSRRRPVRLRQRRAQYQGVAAVWSAVNVTE
jgi:hypothetical protein